MCSHLKNVSAKPITGISVKTTGITKNAILLRSEVSQKEVYRCHMGPSGKRLEPLEKGVNQPTPIGQPSFLEHLAASEMLTAPTAGWLS